MKLKKILLNSDFDKIWKRIINGENISVLRYGDGERAIITGREVTAQEGWKSPNYVSKLGNDLLNSLNLTDSRLYYGISCPCCDIAAYYWYSTRITNSNITFANLWVNANYTKFIKSFEKLDREAVIIANYKAIGKKFGNLKILKYYSIGDNCIDFWENDSEELINNIKKDFGDKKNLLFVVSAGPMSEPIIAELFNNNPDNCYLDLGSSLDKYIHEKQTRPYVNNNSVYAKQNCWMYEPKSINFDVTVILTLYRRPEKLLEQLEAIENQTLKPKEILLFHDSANPPINFEYDDKLKSRISNYIKVDKNIGVWGRFAGGLLATSKYVCFFDDDTIPGIRWLENCHTQIIKKKGLYGTIGIDSWNLKDYPYGSHRRWGWDGSCESTKEVDFVGHSWFLEKDWLGTMWINYSLFYSFKYVAEDAFLSYSLKKWLNIKTFVPPHPKNNQELYGSIPDKALRYGQEVDVAIGFNPMQLKNMNKALRLLVSKGMKSTHFRISSIINKAYIKDKFFPENSKRKKIAKKMVQIIKGN